jgi:ATP-binding cassette subfamily B (MDR/TAP) protein 1
MRPLEEVEKQTTLFDNTELETGEKGPQGVKIEFKDVFFRYPTRDVPVLNGLNMTVRLIRNYLALAMLI